MAKKIRVHRIKTVALTINRPATQENDFVYIGVANKAIKYSSGSRSKIIYIGQTKNGAFRLAQSAATRAYKLLNLNGVTSLTYYIVVPKGRQGTATWKHLETALIAKFRSKYYEAPKANVQGKRFNDDTQSVKKANDFFSEKMIEDIIKRYSHIGD